MTCRFPHKGPVLQKVLPCHDFELLGRCETRFHVNTCHTSFRISLQWRHNERNSVSNHRRIDGLLNRLFKRRSKKTSKPCDGNSPVTAGFPSQRASNAENVSIWWRRNVYPPTLFSSVFFGKFGGLGDSAKSMLKAVLVKKSCYHGTAASQSDARVNLGELTWILTWKFHNNPSFRSLVFDLFATSDEFS